MQLDLRGGHLRLWLGVYEIEVATHLKRLATGARVAYDIGGQLGYDALILSRLVSDRVVSVDSDKECCDVIRHNAGLNPTSQDKVVVHLGEVGSPQKPGVVTIDELAKLYGPPEVVKMDIEGEEVEALRGSTAVLRSSRPRMLIEVHGVSQEEQSKELLREAQYDVLVVDRRTRLLPEYRPLAHNRWLVCWPR